MPAGLVARSSVSLGVPYSRHKEDLRRDFVYSCAYCSIVELEASGIAFQIDHHQPQVHGGSDNYHNLYWACEFCNRRKDGYWPSRGALRAGKRLLRVDYDDADAHLTLDEKDPTSVVASSAVGAVTVGLLDLNRQHFKRLRALRARRLTSGALIANGLRRLATARTDQLPIPLRKAVESLRAEVQKTERVLYETTAELIEKVSRSELLDPDPNEANRSKDRRRFLNDAGALPMRPNGRRRP